MHSTGIHFCHIFTAAQFTQREKKTKHMSRRRHRYQGVNIFNPFEPRAENTTLLQKDSEGVMTEVAKFILSICLAETRSEKAKRKLFRNVTVGAYDGTDGPR